MRNSMRWTGLIFALVVSLIPARAAEKDFQAGTAKVDITPDEGVNATNLVGQRLKSGDRLAARVLVLKDRGVSLAIVSVDLIVFASPKVIAEAKTRWGVNYVLLSATHTHAAMAPRGLLISPPLSPDWTRSGKAPAETIDWSGLSADPWYAATEAKVVAAIGTAMKNLFPARLVTGRGAFESAYMAHNRRLVRDGKASAMWDNPDRRPTSPIDPTIGVIRVEDLTGKPRAFAVHYACHPVATMNSGVMSRDFPGAMVDYVEQQLGSDCLGMFLQGAQGDLDPYDLGNLRGENRFNIAKQSGISLAKGALRLSASLKSPTVKVPPTLQVKESLLTIPDRAGKKMTDVGLLTILINRDLAFLAIPGEPFIQHQLDFAAKSTVKNAMILGLAYHGKGTPYAVYIPTAQAVREGGYGAAECSFLAADAGERMVNEGIAALRELLVPKAPEARP